MKNNTQKHKFILDNMKRMNDNTYERRAQAYLSKIPLVERKHS